jgi:5-methyltetrahydrofolate--homocysteine methyltransferase
VDAVETNTFGANLANLAEYDIPDQIFHLSERGAALAREVADEFSTSEQPRFVLGSVGPGTKLPTLGHAPYATLRDAYGEQCKGLLVGGVDAIIVETSQDLLQTKASIIGAKRAMAAEGRVVPIIAQVTVETTGTMLLGSEIGAALTALEPLGIDLIGLNCATGPAEMSEHLRTLSKHARIPLSVMPNAGLPELGPNGAVYPLSPEELAQALAGFVHEFGTRLVGGCCGTTAEHLRQVAEAVKDLGATQRRPRPEPGVSSLYQAVPFKQDASVLMIGERTNATTWAATARPTCARWPRAWPPRRRCRSCSTRPNRPCSRQAWSVSGAAAPSTRSTTRTATARTPASRRSCGSSPSTARQSWRCASTRRARPAPGTGRSASPSG